MRVHDLSIEDRKKVAPKGEYPAEGFGSKTTFKATGEFRVPRAREYYLSGAIVTAYRAPNDLTEEYWIARDSKEPEPQITLAQFISKHHLKFECHRVESRPDSASEWDATARHFRCRISAPKYDYHRKMCVYRAKCECKLFASFGLYFSQGSARTEDPTLADVLDCLAMDASGYENSINVHPNADEDGFPAWASEYGYDTDSRQAEKIYKTVKRQAEQLKRTLGAQAYQELLWNTERL